MRLSIWQQFSSNNSSDFTLVGEFATPEHALTAAAEISRLLREIGAWYERPENSAALKSIRPPRNSRDQPLTPIELEFSQHYDIAWPEAIDWMRKATWEAKALDIQDRFVLITNDPFAYSWMGCEPLDQLIERLGGKAVCKARGGAYGVAVVTADAPDLATATQLYDTISAYFGASHLSAGTGLAIPWLAYWKAELVAPDVIPDDRTALEAAYLARELGQDQFYEATRERMEYLLTEADHAQANGDNERAAALRKEWKVMKIDGLKHLPRLMPEDEKYLRTARQCAEAEGDVQRTEQHLTLTFPAHPTSNNLFAILQYLRSHGCTDLHFTFEQRFSKKS